MKNIIGILAIVFFITGCDSNGFLEKIGLKEKISTVTQTRNELAYLPNSDEPFTGKYVTYYLNGQKKTEINYKEGKRNGLTTGWYENGQKESETNFKEGKDNALATGWQLMKFDLSTGGSASGSGWTTASLFRYLLSM